MASARGFSPRQSVVQIYGTCEACRTGRPATASEGQPELLFARDALRIAIATERSGRDFYTRAARITRDARARTVFLKLSEEEVGHLGRLEGRYRELLALDPELEARPTFLFFKGAANGLFSEGAEALSRVTSDREALMLGIRCERGSHRFFKKYGERFEDSEGKRIFLEFADEEREHLELLIREYRDLVRREPKPRSTPARARRPPRPGRQARLDPRVIDLHVHSTASDGTLAPEALASRLARDGVTTFSLCDHDTTAGLAAAAEGARAAGLGFLTGIEITAIEDGKDVHVLGYGIDPASAPLAAFLAEQRSHRRARIVAIEERLAALGVPVTLVQDGRASGDDAGRAIGRPVVARALVAAGHVASISEAFDRYLTPGQPAFVPRTGAPVPEVVAMIARAGGIASLAHPGQTKRDDAIERWVAAGLPAIEVWHSHHDDEAVARYAAIAERYGLLTTGGSDFHGDDTGRVYRVGEVGAPPEAFVRLTARLGQPVVERR